MPSAPPQPPPPPWQGIRGWLQGVAGKTIVVTGASSGIGRAVALELAGAGARTALVARRRPLLEALAGEIEAAGGAALVVPADVTDRAQVAAAFATVAERLGQPDLVVNNAGVLRPGPVADLTADDLDFMLRVNLFGALFVMQEAIRAMRAGAGGTIVNVASLAGRRGVSPLGGYCASKFALVGLTEALRTELAGEPIHLALVLPGFVDTAMVESATHDGEILDLWPAWFTMPPSWVVWAIVAAARFRLREVSVPPGAATLEKLGALAPALGDAVIDWARRIGHWAATQTHQR